MFLLFVAKTKEKILNIFFFWTIFIIPYYCFCCRSTYHMTQNYLVEYRQLVAFNSGQKIALRVFYFIWVHIGCLRPLLLKWPLRLTKMLEQLSRTRFFTGIKFSRTFLRCYVAGEKKGANFKSRKKSFSWNIS